MNEFTKEDLKVLHELSSDTSPLKDILEDIDFDPVKLEKFLRDFPREHHAVYDIDYFDLGMELDNPKIHGYLVWRLEIGK